MYSTEKSNSCSASMVRAGLPGLILLVLLAFPLLASAQLRIEIVDGVEGAMPIAVVPFAWDSDLPEPATGVAEIISANLARSGLFEPMAEAQMIEQPARPPEVRFGTWRLLRVDHLVIGRVVDSPDGIGQEIEYHLLDVHSGRILLSQALSVSPGDLRFGAHRVSDAVYESLIGVPGAFATRMAYVVVSDIGGDDELFELVVADADGFNPQTVVRNTQPILSPAWSPDGRRLAYVSFATGRSNVIVQDLFTGQTEIVSSSRGINGAPAFSPDGQRLAVSLSQGGSPDVWLIDLSNGRRQQLTHHWSINTEPAWSPDGERIYFTSDRAGRPQVHVMDADGGNLQRVTFDGRYNAGVSIGLEERFLAVVHSEGDNDFRIAIFDRENERMRVLSDGRLDESPSFAPNGSMLLYAARENGRGVLAAVSADGRIRQRLVASEGDVREPAWSPMIR